MSSILTAAARWAETHRSATPEQRRPHAVPALCLAAFGALWLALAVAPRYPKDWLLENLLTFVAVPALLLTYRRFRFSDRAYVQGPFSSPSTRLAAITPTPRSPSGSGCATVSAGPETTTIASFISPSGCSSFARSWSSRFVGEISWAASGGCSSSSRRSRS